MSYQSWMGEGFLGNDAEMRYTPQTNKAVTTFSLAIDNGYGEHKSTLWFRVTTWEKLAEQVAELRKGAHVLVIGRVEQARPWTDKEGNQRASLEVTAQTVRFLDKKTQDGEHADAAPAQRQAQPVSKLPTEADIPF